MTTLPWVLAVAAGVAFDVGKLAKLALAFAMLGIFAVAIFG